MAECLKWGSPCLANLRPFQTPVCSSKQAKISYSNKTVLLPKKLENTSQGKDAGTWAYHPAICGSHRFLLVCKHLIGSEGGVLGLFTVPSRSAAYPVLGCSCASGKLAGWSRSMSMINSCLRHSSLEGLVGRDPSYCNFTSLDVGAMRVIWSQSRDPTPSGSHL
jgi:hypothetical protein